MLRMGFIDAVESILEQTPPQRQVALFSATIPAPIRRIAQKHLRTPVEVTIKSKTSTATNIRQRYWMVSGMHKLDALTRILEAETFDGMLVFTRTKQATVELAEKLEARGFAAAPLNGDIAAAAARAHRGALESRPDRHPGRHRRGGPRARRRTHRPCGELRCALRHRILRASHWPHGPSGAQGRGDPVHRAARAQHAARHRARHAAGHRTDESAERRCGQYPANRQVQTAHHRDHRQGRQQSLPAGAGAAGDRIRNGLDRHCRGAREPVARNHPAAAGAEG